MEQQVPTTREQTPRHLRNQRASKGALRLWSNPRGRSRRRTEVETPPLSAPPAPGLTPRSLTRRLPPREAPGKRVTETAVSPAATPSSPLT